ncbi:MAG: hypothetical protein KDB37_10945 [Ilumatobacter sp.]|nr:hypothetical protein [Ilumatobacter sp.]
MITIVAGAGFGKSTAVAAALRDNAESPQGDDCWLTCEPADNDAGHLAFGLWSALHPGTPVDRAGVRPGAAALTEAIWARAPRHVCLILDDVHDVHRGSSGAQLLDELLRSLPTNGHMLLVARTKPPVGLARARALGHVADVTEADLAFTADEIHAFAAMRHIDSGQLEQVGGWPALAELTAGAGSNGVGEFLFEEVLARRSPVDVEVIETVALVGSADHELAADVAGISLSSNDFAHLLSDVPMAGHDDGGWWTLHPLWADAIRNRVHPARRRDILRRAGRALRVRDPMRAIELLVDSDAVEALVEAVRSLLETPWVDAPAEQLLAAHRRIPVSACDRPEVQLLLAAATAPTNPVAARDLLRHVADLAESIGDDRLGLLAVERLVVLCHRRQDVAGVIDAFARADRLATGDHTRATALVVLGKALLAEAAGDATLVLHHLDRLATGELDGYWLAPVAWMRAQALLALGHPGAALAESTIAIESAPIGLRGEFAMLHVNALALAGRCEEALDLVESTIELLDRYGTIEARAMARGQAVQRLAIVGQVECARHYLETARDIAGPEPPAPVHANLAAAETALAIATCDEDRARDVMARSIERHPLGVGRHQYHERRRLALSYVLLPATRRFWDEEPLGPVFLHARESAQALVAVREDGDLRLAGRLRASHWESAWAMMPLPWGIELALAGSAAGSELATEALSALPPARSDVIHAIATRSDVPAVSRRAADVLLTMPQVPTHPVHVQALGPLNVARAGRAVDDPNWRRGRVRSLLAFLVTRRSTTRSAAAAALWPDLDEAAADRNLRVTLSYLHGVLEPGRPSGTPTFVVRTDGGRLELTDQRPVIIDVDEFERAISAAAVEQQRGAPATEVRHLLDAVTCYRGPFLADLGNEEWVLDERDRFRVAFVAAAVRAGELVLASGDALAARDLAARAIAEEPWSEPARRLLVAAYLESGDRAAARRALVACRAMLEDLGVRAEPETEILARRLGESP